MTNQENLDLERKEIAILKILKDATEPMGARLIAHRLKDFGIDLTERTVRSHLQIMDERGLTHSATQRRGRLVTESGKNELDNALVGDRVGAAKTNIETLICKTSFELDKLAGEVPINVSLFPAEQFNQALKVMKIVGTTDLCTVNLEYIARIGENLGNIKIPEGKVGFATLSNIMMSAILLRAGIPLDFRFAGVLQVKNYYCLRFIDLIEYAGSSLNPFEIFISTKMTSVRSVARDGNGKILASFCEMPASALPKVEAAKERLEEIGIKSVARLGRINEPLCEIPVGMGKAGIILTDGLNLVAAAAESGIEVENHAGCTMFEFARMRDLSNI